MGGGAMAEETVANAASVFPVPDGVTLEQAAAFPVAFGTAHLALTRYARVTKGSTVLILGAAGGVGLAAVQIAKALGCVVVAAANGVRKMDALRDAGADHCIDASLLHSADGGGIRAGRRDDYAGLKGAVARALNGGGDGLKSFQKAWMFCSIPSAATGSRKGFDAFDGAARSWCSASPVVSSRSSR